MSHYDALFRWNPWGSWKIPVGYPRAQAEMICQYLAGDEVIALIGPRRAGKSTMLYQVMAHLIESGVEPKSILHINFEEPGLSPELSLELLDQLYDTYRARVNPSNKAYIFLDEIQNIPHWERWVRARNETESVKILITGSSATLMSRELASVLTGRNLTFTVYPLSFQEALSFNKVTIAQEPWPDKAPAEIEHALTDYLTWGGFPKVVLTPDNSHRERLLKRYIDDIILKDVVMRHQIRDVIALKNMAIHLLTNTASLMTYKRMADTFEVSQDLAQNYVHYLREAFIIETMGIYSLKATERKRNPSKVYTNDLGLRHVVSLSGSMDFGKQLETIVYQHLHREANGGVFYWQGKGEVDFLVTQSNQITDLIQVAQHVNDEKTLNREINSLLAAKAQYPKAQCRLITRYPVNNACRKIADEIEFIPLWQFLLKAAI